MTPQQLFVTILSMHLFFRSVKHLVQWNGVTGNEQLKRHIHTRTLVWLWVDIFVDIIVAVELLK